MLPQRYQMYCFILFTYFKYVPEIRYAHIEVTQLNDRAELKILYCISGKTTRQTSYKDNCDVYRKIEYYLSLTFRHNNQIATET